MISIRDKKKNKMSLYTWDNIGSNADIYRFGNSIIIISFVVFASLLWRLPTITIEINISQK